MIRNLMSAAFAIVATASLCASAAHAKPMAIACHELLPPGPVPGDEGSYLTILHVTITAGSDGHRHHHHAAEYLAVVSGGGTLSIADQGDIVLHPGVIATIPPGIDHQIHNDSGTEPLVVTATLIGHVDDPQVTRYVGEPDSTFGCPHKRSAPQ